MGTISCGCDHEANYLCSWHGSLKPLTELQTERPETPGYFPEFSQVVYAPNRASTLPAAAPERKQYPIATGVLDYFPDAIVALAHVSWQGNEQHNPGEPLHWARGKSMDQDDTLMRHFLERGTLDSDGHRHSAKMAWRALAILQLEIEAERKK